MIALIIKRQQKQGNLDEYYHSIEDIFDRETFRNLKKKIRYTKTPNEQAKLDNFFCTKLNIQNR